MLKYILNTIKSLLLNKTVVPQYTDTWKSILKDGKVVPKNKKNMLIPSNRVLIWKTEESKEKRKRHMQTGVNFMFQFQYDEDQFVIKTQRTFDQKLYSEALPKISALMKKKVFKGKPDTSENGISIELSPQLAHLVTEEFTVNNFADDQRITTLLVNGSEFKVVRNGIPIAFASLALSPIVGNFCMPSIVFNVKETPVNLHWFVQNETEKISRVRNDTNPSALSQISFINEEKRQYNLNGFTYKETGPYYAPDSNDINKLVAVVVETGRDYPVYAATSSKQVSEMPESVITEEQVKWCKNNRLKDNDDIIRVMSYNILADLYLNLNLPQEELFFNYCPKSSQRMFYRTPILLKQLHDFINGQVSILFFQEVDISRHENFIAPFLETLNYSSEIAKKTSTISEGVAILFDRRRFRLLDSKSFGLAEVVATEDINSDIRRILENSIVSKERFATRPAVMQVVVLEDTMTGKVLVCGNTHLHHNPREEHLKFLQALACTRQLMKIYNDRKAMEPELDIRVLFGGDFNSTPDGAVFHLLNEGVLPKEHIAWKCDENIVPENISIERKLECLTGTPEYTNYTASSCKEGFIGCLDYIWGIGISSIRSCPLPDHQKVIRYEALPSPISPSDHLPIISDVKL